jgi:4-diphosphocytidyl-2-C-methyl-D-erythritol kinase
MSDAASPIEYRSPARLCLTYEVRGPRPNSLDRYSVVAVMQELALTDTLRFSPREDSSINLTIELSDTLPSVVDGLERGVEAHNNLIIRAAQLLRQVHGIQAGADIHLVKRIPIGWGLAGAASNAATTLRALRQLWSLNLDYSNLLNLADILSPHAPYFIISGTALVESNEQITPLPPLQQSWALIISPSVSIADKSADLFSLLRWHMMGNGLVSRQLAATLRQGARPNAALFTSTLEWVVGLRYPEIEDCRRDAVAAGITDLRYCGPGPCLFALYPTEEEAREAQEKMKDTPWPTMVSVTAGLRIKASYCPTFYTLHSAKGAISACVSILPTLFWKSALATAPTRVAMCYVIAT